MTRKEIRERAAEIAHYFVVYPKPRDHQKAERILGEVVRATLEEAARADCYSCLKGRPIGRRTPGAQRWHDWTDDDGRECSARCTAEGANDLIAALDKEASHE